MDAILSCQGLTKLYGQKAALVDFTYDFPKGRIVGLLGPNGSGKTTLAKILTGLEQPDSGEVFCRGERVDRKNRKRNNLNFHLQHRLCSRKPVQN